MLYVKIVILCAAIFVMQTVGIVYMQRKQLTQSRTVREKIMYFFPLTKRRKIYYMVTMLIGIALSYVLVTVYGNSGIFIQKIRMVVLYGILCPIAVIDYRVQKIPNKLLLFTTVIWIVSVLAEGMKNPQLVLNDFKFSIYASIGICVVCLICKVLIKNGVGMGDIKLFMVMGLLQGPSGMSGAVFMSMIVAFLAHWCC